MPLPIKYLEAIRGGAPIQDYASKGCLHPYTIPITDSFNHHRSLVCDCGYCLNCQDQKRNEWVTRMILHSYSPINKSSVWRYCYYVTLTYGSYDLFEYEIHPFKNDWLASYPTRDMHNERGVLAWGPSIIVVQHVQKFLKRLRACYPNQHISFCRASEYGEDFGRPHHHVIIWSTCPISQDDVFHSWGYYTLSNPRVKNRVFPYRGQSTEHGKYQGWTKDFFSIGRVDMHDLGANGSMNSDSLVDPEKDAAHNFAYVAKYVNKYEVNWSDFAIQRLLRVYYQLPLYSTESGTLEPGEVDLTTATRNFNFNDIYPGVLYENLSFKDFKKVVSPSFSSSLGYSIGKSYALCHLKSFASGNFALPRWRGRTLVFPKFFRHLLSLSQNPLRFEKCTVSGRTFVKSDSAVVLDLLYQLADTRVPVSDIPLAKAFKSMYQTRDSILPGSPLEFVLHSPNGVVRALYDVSDDTFKYFRFDRSARAFRFIDVDTRLDACEKFITILEDSAVRADEIGPKFEAALDLFNLMEGSREYKVESPDSTPDHPKFKDLDELLVGSPDNTGGIWSKYENCATIDIPNNVLVARADYIAYRLRKKQDYKNRHKSLES